MGRLAVIIQILLPAAFSQALAGLRVGWARAWRALIGAEMVFGAIGATGGLGWYIFKQRAMMNTPGLFAGVLLVTVVGMAVEGLLFDPLERRTLRKWNGAARGEGEQTCFFPVFTEKRTGRRDRRRSCPACRRSIVPFQNGPRKRYGQTVCTGAQTVL